MITQQSGDSEIVDHLKLLKLAYNGGAQYIRRGQSSPIRLVFWVELGPIPGYVVDSSGPGLERLTARGIMS